jgi:4-hydroxybutyryl-CoA dehydratase/vinylacetyl-CoA-Delta-isomerase
MDKGEQKMGLITSSEFKESLKDGRIVYIEGEKVEDVTTHPKLKTAVETAAFDYEMAEMSEYRALAVVNDELTREEYSRYFHRPKNSEDLLKRHELMLATSRLNYTTTPFAREMVDAFNGCLITAYAIGNGDYIDRAEFYLKYLKENDLSIAGAITDVKGDRSLRPSDPQQKHPDYYLRVVDKDKDGIVVRGAKAHITASAYLNELIVMPCRNMTEVDADYAMAFAVPVSADGIIQIVHPFDYQRGPLDFPVNVPVRSHTDALVIFNDVFVPWEKVFLCGEWKFAATAVYNFAYLHRHTAVTYHIAWVELLVGLAAAMAEYNGISRASGIRDQMTELIYYLNTMKSLARASCLDCVIHEGIAVPNPVTANVAKYFYANNYHNITKIIQDICGGLLTTAPTYKDWQKDELEVFLSKYLGGRADASAEARLRILQTLRHYPCLGLELEVNNIHAEGSLMAERLTIYSEASQDLKLYKKLAEVLAGVIEMDWPQYVELCQELGNLGKGAQSA